MRTTLTFYVTDSMVSMHIPQRGVESVSRFLIPAVNHTRSEKACMPFIGHASTA